MNIPVHSFKREKIRIPEEVRLADPDFNVNQPVDLILNADVFWEVISAGRIKIAEPSLYLSETLLGWIIGGAFDSIQRSCVAVAVCNSSVKINESRELMEVVQKFWLQEEILETDNKSWTLDEQKCEDQFVNTHQRDPSDGRFIIQLPFKNEVPSLGDSAKVALKRFVSLENKFRRDPDLRMHTRMHSRSMSQRE